METLCYNMDYGSILLATVIISKHVTGLVLLSFSTILLLMSKKGGNSVGQFGDINQSAEKEADRHEESDGDGSKETGEEKCKQMIAQLLAFKEM